MNEDEIVMPRILTISAAALVLALAAGVPVANASVAPANIAAEPGERSAGAGQEEGSNVLARTKICFTTTCYIKERRRIDRNKRAR